MTSCANFLPSSRVYVWASRNCTTSTPAASNASMAPFVRFCPLMRAWLIWNMAMGPLGQPLAASAAASASADALAPSKLLVMMNET